MNEAVTMQLDPSPGDTVETATHVDGCNVTMINDSTCTHEPSQLFHALVIKSADQPLRTSLKGQSNYQRRNAWHMVQAGHANQR